MVNICLFANFLFEITFLMRKWNIYIVILKFHASVTTYYQAMYVLPHNSELREQNHCQTGS